MEEVKNKETKTPNRSVWKNFKSTYKYAKTGRKYLWFFLVSIIVMTIISIIAPIIFIISFIMMLEETCK